MVMQVNLLAMIRMTTSSTYQMTRLIPHSLSFKRRVRTIIIRKNSKEGVTHMFVIHMFLIMIRTNEGNGKLRPIFVSNFTRRKMNTSIRVMAMEQAFIMAIKKLNTSMYTRNVRNGQLPKNRLLRMMRIRRQATTLTLLLFRNNMYLYPICGLFLARVTQRIARITTR